MPIPPFERSAELKRLFNQHFTHWSKQHRLGMSELADRCGVSVQYLAHVGRYGRVPSRPILLLLALNFDLERPHELLKAAGSGDTWPFDAELALRPRSAADTGFLSLNLDMRGFTSAIREIVREEVKPKSLGELLGKKPLRVGLNPGQTFLFQRQGKAIDEGFFPELARLLSLTLHSTVLFSPVSHARFAEALERREIDLYGPVYYTAHRISQALYTAPFCSVRMGALGRTRETPTLAPLPKPRTISDLSKRPYVIAVHADSMSHHFALSDLGIPSERIIPCETSDESIERIIMREIPRPAHLLLTDAPHAYRIHAAHLKDTLPLFSPADRNMAWYEDTIAVRPDWREVVVALNDGLAFLQRNGSIKRLFDRTVDSDGTPGVTLPT